ncbi:hypothetical protein F5146DRAFT_1008584 [Armillaria mellea]|nr:hypothetical protein F5146DRAFT_1008584 [Armillaria mellea]
MPAKDLWIPLQPLSKIRIYRTKPPKSLQTYAMERHYENQRHNADNADENTERAWYALMRKIMEEMNQFCPFLDLGCCPGGFSSYILDTNPRATGVGVSLSPQEGGHPFLMDENLLNRYSIIFANMAKFELGPDSDLALLPIPANSFDLVVMDAHHLRNQPHMAADKVYISQIILGLRAVKIGGSVVLKLHRIESEFTARLLYLLDNVSWKIRTFKPLTMHKDRGSFYLIARGVGFDNLGRLSVQRQTLLRHAMNSLRTVWVNFGEEGSERHFVAEDLDFIITVDDLVKVYTYRLGRLGRKIWEIREDTWVVVQDERGYGRVVLLSIHSGVFQGVIIEFFGTDHKRARSTIEGKNSGREEFENRSTRKRAGLTGATVAPSPSSAILENILIKKLANPTTWSRTSTHLEICTSGIGPGDELILGCKFVYIPPQEYGSLYYDRWDSGWFRKISQFKIYQRTKYMHSEPTLKDSLRLRNKFEDHTPKGTTYELVS